MHKHLPSRHSGLSGALAADAAIAAPNIARAQQSVEATKLVLKAERAKSGTTAEGMARMHVFPAELGHATPRALTHSRRSRVSILTVGLHQYYQTPGLSPPFGSMHGRNARTR